MLHHKLVQTMLDALEYGIGFLDTYLNPSRLPKSKSLLRYWHYKTVCYGNAYYAKHNIKGFIAFEQKVFI